MNATGAGRFMSRHSRILTCAAVLSLVLVGLSCFHSTAPDPGSAEHPSSQPPAGLAPAQVPQFVTFGFDDNGISGREGSGTTGGLHFVKHLFEGKRNADGSPARFSLYANTRYIDVADVDKPEYVRAAWREIADAGHEIGIHTHNHPHGAQFQ